MKTPFPFTRSFWASTGLCFLLLASGCATGSKQPSQGQQPVPNAATQAQGTPGTQQATGPASVEEQKAQTAWRSYLVRAKAVPRTQGAFRISASVRYTTPQETQRVSALLWGNGKPGSPYPLRLDLLAGVGSIVAKVRETEHSFTAFVPDENVAYIHPEGARTLASFGVPIPLDLHSLTQMLTGRGHVLLLPAGASLEAPMPTGFTVSQEGVRFPLPTAPLGGSLLLSPEGVPVEWQEDGDKGWVIGIEPENTGSLRPAKLRISHPNGYGALLVLKEITAMPAPFTKENMNLVLPKGVTERPLEQ